jgi:mannose-6-phosphate isomerase-like protein (cupin superfamily)
MLSDMDAINLDAKLARISEHWAPRSVARLNDYDIKVVKVLGEFVWHTHADTDELFLVHAGRLTIRLREGSVELGPGELFVVPRGVEHQPYAEQEASVLLIEPAHVINTGDGQPGAMTRPVEPI